MVAATLDGDPLTLAGNRIALDVTAGEHEVRVVARCAYTRSGEGLHRFVDPADDQVYVYAQAFLDDAQRIYPCFDQPDLKAVFRLRVTAPEGHLVLSNTRGSRDGDAFAFEPTVRLSTYHLTLASRTVVRPAGLARRDRAGGVVPRLAGRALRPGGAAAGHPRLLRPAAAGVRLALPVRRHLRPGLRPGVQRRGDGEPGDGDLRRRELRLPLAHHGGEPPDAGPGDRARDGAHVVRRPGDDALVGRRLAQRVVRGVHGAAHHRRGHPVPRRLERLLPRPQGLGLPGRPAARPRTRSPATSPTTGRRC